MVKCELIHDNFQNFKCYNIPSKAQLVIADIPLKVITEAGKVLLVAVLINAPFWLYFMGVI